MKKNRMRWAALLISVLFSANTLTVVYAENLPSISDNTIESDSAADAERELQIEEVREEIADAEYVEDEILVVTQDNTCHIVELAEGEDLAEAIVDYEELPSVAYAQPNYIYRPEEIIPESANDAYNANQYYFNTIGIHAAWDMVSGRPLSDVSVAVIDTGIQTTHPDLQNNIDFARSRNIRTPYTTISSDIDGHGTHVAGIIAATANNGIGVAGIGYNHAKVTILQFKDSSGSALSSDLAPAIDYACSIGVRIINMSLGLEGGSDTLVEQALQRAYNAGVLVVCSAGNNSTDAPHYPSGYPTTIGIIATDSAGYRFAPSNYGTDNFISAPGASIYSTMIGGSYAYLSGTSMAAAVVSGCAAFLLSIDPSLTPQQIKNLLASTATDTYTAGFDAYSGYGVINLEAATAKLIGKRVPSVYIPDDVKNPTSVDNFVKRLYYYCLDREPEASGLNYWIGMLKSKKENGGQVAYGFLFSDEFKNRNYSDDDYVTLLYNVFLGREPDPSGKAYWVTQLSEGMSRQYVMNGFSNSMEFTNICKACGFSSGQMTSSEARDANPKTTAFVARLYTKALGRPYDADGLNYWCKQLNDKKLTAYSVAVKGFFHSQEFLSKGTNDAEFIKILYRTFLGRECDEAGYQYWMGRLQKGSSRDTIIAEFANSKEFKTLTAQHGL